MTDSNPPNDDPAELARRFADLWQEQLSAMAADPAMAKACADSLQVWQNLAGQMGMSQMGIPPSPATASGTDPAAAMMQAWTGMLGQMSGGQMAGGQTGGAETRGAGGSDNGTRGTEAASGASGGSEQLLRDILSRLDALERRIDALEPGAGRAGGGVGKGSGAKRGAAKQSTAKGPAKKSAGKRSAGKRAPSRK